MQQSFESHSDDNHILGLMPDMRSKTLNVKANLLLISVFSYPDSKDVLLRTEPVVGRIELQLSGGKN